MCSSLSSDSWLHSTTVNTAQVSQLPYPIKAKPLGKFRYFQKREEWKLTDVLFNPMVMMMVMPLLLITVLPKMMQDPETKKEMEEMQAKMNVQSQVKELVIDGMMEPPADAGHVGDADQSVGGRGGGGPGWTDKKESSGSAAAAVEAAQRFQNNLSSQCDLFPQFRHYTHFIVY